MDADASASRWAGLARDAVRVAVAGLVLAPGASKFLTYGRSVRFFATLDIPAPAVLVVVVGVVEVGAGVALLADRYARLAAFSLLPVMAVAAATAGPTWQNLAVLAGGAALLARDTFIA